MKFREIFRFEFVYQTRRIRTWLYFAVLFAIAYQLRKTGDGRDVQVISPYDIALETVLAVLLWVLLASTVAGSAAARDVQTRMHPLIYAAPIRKSEYLGGRFLAAFALNALILLAAPLGSLAALFLSGVKPDIIRSQGPAIYVSTYGLLVLPTVFAFTAVQFSVALLNRRAFLSYLGSVLLALSASIGAVLFNVLNMQTLGKLLDPACRFNVAIVMGDTLTPLEKNTVLIGLEGSILANRLLWVCVASAILVFTYVRFRPGHRPA